MARSLNNAKVAKNDEFYTQLTDIEKELRYYKSHFEGKTVLCNCDDPYESNFFKYFAMNFNQLRLKKLLAVCYDGSPVAGSELLLDFGDEFAKTETQPQRTAYKIEISEVTDVNGDGAIDLGDVEYLLKNDRNVLTKLRGNGDFRSAESIELLQQADIVCTNPPFSLFREYVAQLVEYEKKYLIIGNMNAITYREIFYLISNNQQWLGYTSPKSFIKPDKTTQKFGNILWYTNLDIKKRHEDFESNLFKHYVPNEYPKYANYDAINVNKLSDIPCDFVGIMGVPLTFLDKYNPDQFEIIGRTGDIEWASKECNFFTPPSADKIAKYKKQDTTWRVQNPYFVDENDRVHTIYFRILIRRKQKGYELGAEQTNIAAEPK